MGSTSGTSEIVESNEDLNLENYFGGSKTLRFKLKSNVQDGKCQDLEDNLDQLLRAIYLRTSSRVLGPSSQPGVDSLWKNDTKKPAKVGVSRSSGIGISGSVTLKQALRKLSIIQASEMAALKKLSKPISFSGTPEAGIIKRLCASVMIPSSKLNEEKRSLVEISIMPEKVSADFSKTATEFGQEENMEMSIKSSVSSLSTVSAPKLTKIKIQDAIKPTPEESCESHSATVKMIRDIASSKAVAVTSNTKVNPHLTKSVHRNNTLKKKGKFKASSAAIVSTTHAEVNRIGRTLSISKQSQSKESAMPSCTTPRPKSCLLKEQLTTACSMPLTKSCYHKEPVTPAPGAVSAESKILLSPNIHRGIRAISVNSSEFSRSREKGECYHSSKSSIGDYSSSTSISEESHQSSASGKGCRPHTSKDERWIAIQRLIQQRSLDLNNFKLLKKLGCGHIGTVYLAEMIGSDCLFALKVMDIEFLISRKKLLRAQTEREILQMLDHPFLPTLYAYFTTDNLFCLVMEYCPGGNLHALRQKQPGRSFSEPAARFYVAEVLLALEYLHMLGIIYRDLKPENILVREDGHIVLSDFYLSLRCSVSPTLLRSSSIGTQASSKKLSGAAVCLQQPWVQVSCFTPRLLWKQKSEACAQVRSLPQLVVEPTGARSNSFVGSHEYLAPEIIRGDGHGSAVDWWALGILLYELLFGRTPFEGPGNDETWMNVASQSLKFPENPSSVSFLARDLIRGLLVKEPENRLGSVKGAAEIKQHPFFEGLNWALIRCTAPPETPRSHDIRKPVVLHKKKEGKCLCFRTRKGEDSEFELF